MILCKKNREETLSTEIVSTVGLWELCLLFQSHSLLIKRCYKTFPIPSGRTGLAKCTLSKVLLLKAVIRENNSPF